VNLSLNEQLHDEQLESNSLVISLALAISLALHFTVMLALPWIEAVKVKPPITIIAELQQLPPPPPPPPVEAPAEPKPVEPPAKPEVVKVERILIPKPAKLAPKPQVVAQPVLAAEHSEQVSSDYSVPDTPQPTIAPSEPTAPAAPELSSASASSTKNEATSTSSNTTWDDSDLWDEYGRKLQRLVERNKQYPVIAIRRGWQGLAKVLVNFSSEGKAISVVIEKSAGQKVLDEQALEMVKKSLNDLPVPNKFKGREFRIIVPVEFKLE
jgi:protein TonB